jgi:hypothetical protein
MRAAAKSGGAIASTDAASIDHVSPSSCCPRLTNLSAIKGSAYRLELVKAKS